ncbi:MAG: glycosyltransferase family 4 protein [Thermodesulfobacteriota bacterium]
MHICHINLAKGFHGGERQTLNLLGQLQALAIRQSLVCPPGSRLQQEAEAAGIETIGVSHWLRGHRHPAPGTVLHGHCGQSVHWAAIQHLCHRQPYVVTRRVDNPIGQNPWTRYCYQHASAIACLSSAIEIEVAKIAGSVRRVRIPSSYSGFQADPEKVTRIRQDFPGKILIGQVGKMIAHKGFRFTIDAARLLQRDCPQIHVLLLGDGPLWPELQDQARDLANLTMLGHVDDIGNYLAALDLLVFPSLHEGMGSTILEAMQHEVPVVAAKAGGIPDLIEDGVTGLLVAPGNAQALAAAIRALLERPELARSLAREARGQLSRFSPQAMAGRYLELYQSLSPAVLPENCIR